MSGFSIKTKRERKNPNIEAAKKQLMEETEEQSQLRVDIPQKLHRKLHRLKADSAAQTYLNEYIVEAIEDLLTKYQQGNGKYPRLED